MRAPKAEAEQCPLQHTIYLDIFWCTGAFRGLIREQRKALFDYFGGRVQNVPRNSERLSLAKRMYIHGTVNRIIWKFLWPLQPDSRFFWDAVKEKKMGRCPMRMITSSNQSKRCIISKLVAACTYVSLHLQTKFRCRSGSFARPS